ncbi:hypothetical protein GOB91_17245 [Sinorhizobium meliloti]|uniref:hypothetical protein n=2 Tax=Rhizobium meliloti TaxID=382 RepID=UPI0002FA5B06|nr:hypothetical protein [Sinorhizobium meliloti]MDE3876051.1 hypothetical protein [Sinorhizobium meliloti]MDW9390563.1 hypothetical protein [Sinorhizobium meliloti]MDW9435226.1 hypothetical protein [Sinorhizobium meliloti]MDW9481038.1 hypothetical protein [Sinorhizobium meliloti]MDW9507269.1 hypothetical protein [Sinorhizobium meliloti]
MTGSISATAQASVQTQNANPSQAQFEEALQQAVAAGGSQLIGQEMMKIAQEILNEALSDEE